MAEMALQELTSKDVVPDTEIGKQTLSGEAVLDALKMILADAPLADVLTSVTCLIEAQRPGLLCSIFLLDSDGVHLRYAAAPNLPESYRSATDGLAIGPNAGSCGTAVYRREAVFISDILSDPLWTRFREIAVAAGLRAAWSSPIMSNDGRVLGTFGMYYREIRNPTPDDIRLIDHASRIAGIAIEREQSQKALKEAFARLGKSEAHLRDVVDAIRYDVCVLAADGSLIYVNRAVLEFIGLSEAEAMESDFRLRAFHPEDQEKLRDVRRAGFAGSVPWENEVRVRRYDGQVSLVSHPP
jgi:PAS domain S-box-containing protein